MELDAATVASRLGVVSHGGRRMNLPPWCDDVDGRYG